MRFKWGKSSKRGRPEKATLRWRPALRSGCTRRQHLKREASETRFAQTADASFSVSGTGDASPSNGISLQRQRQLHKQRQRQRQRSLRGRQKQPQRSLREAASIQCGCMLTGVGGISEAHSTMRRSWKSVVCRREGVMRRRLLHPASRPAMHLYPVPFIDRGSHITRSGNA
jgi:hypothetical protein